MTLLPEQVFEPATDDALAQDPLAGSEEESPDSLDPDTLVAGVEALRRFLRAVDGHVPESDLVRARTVVERAGERLELSRDHTVVALVGATGSGKSSMFNALAGLPLSPVGSDAPRPPSPMPVPGARTVPGRCWTGWGCHPVTGSTGKARSTATNWRRCGA